MSEIIVYLIIGLYFLICIVLFRFQQYQIKQTEKYVKWCLKVSDEGYKESMEMLSITVTEYTQLVDNYIRIVDTLKCCANCKHHESSPSYCHLTNTECYAEYICSKWEIKENNGTRQSN